MFSLITKRVLINIKLYIYIQKIFPQVVGATKKNPRNFKPNLLILKSIIHTMNGTYENK